MSNGSECMRFAMQISLWERGGAESLCASVATESVMSALKVIAK